jgi:hypothetical protein
VDRLNQVAGDFDFLCNKIVNGECRTLACLRRGGYDDELCRARGIKPPDPLVATCPALEKAGAMRRAATLRAAANRTECLIGDTPHPKFAEGVLAAGDLLERIAAELEASNV